MNLVTRKPAWDPFQELNEMHNRLATLFNRAVLPPSNGGESITTADWAPVVDITEDEKEYLLKAELPGLKRDEVKVTVENGILSISGERKVEKEEKGRKFHRIERAYGSFVRTFALPDDVDAAKVNAEFKEGVLHVHLAKSAKAQPKTITIQ